MYFGLKIAHSALTGNYRSDQAFTWHPCAYLRWQMDVPAPDPLFCISFLEGCVITVQTNWDPALGLAAVRGKRRGAKRTPCAPGQLCGVGTGGWGTTRGWLCCGRAAHCLETGAEGTGFVLFLWQVRYRKCSPRGRRTKVAASPLHCVALVSRAGRRGSWHTFHQAQAALVESRAPWDAQLSWLQIWS